MRLVFLDYLRVFAFVSVLIGHKYASAIAQTISTERLPEPVRLLFKAATPFYLNGGAGVIVFFLISGYIVIKVAQAQSPLEFIIKRIFRIYPLYVTVVTAEAIAFASLTGRPFPPLAIIIPQLLLIGDFFGAPLTLAGVEWTLRVELIFYLFVFIIGSIGIIKREFAVVIIFFIVFILLQVIGPISIDGFVGYFTIFYPWILVGSIIYLAEKIPRLRTLSGIFALFVIIVFVTRGSAINPNGGKIEYLSGALVFMAAYVWRRHLPDSRFIAFVSALTYSVYLLHNWSWDYLRMLLTPMAGENLMREALIPIVLFGVCLVASLLVEQPGMRFGAKAARWAAARWPRVPVSRAT